MAPEATKMAVRCNMQMDIRVIEDLDFKSQVKFHIQGYQGHMEFTIASEVITKAARDIMHMDTAGERDGRGNPENCDRSYIMVVLDKTK